MPEGHTIHRLARQFRRDLGGQRVRAVSPQGRFTQGAALLDGSTLVATDAHGKHLFLGFGADGAPAQRWLHVHLGLYGAWTFGSLDGEGGAPEPRGAVRLRVAGDSAYADLRAPIACDVLTRTGKNVLQAGLGPDPLRRRADPAPFLARVARSTAPVGVLLMDQSVLSGVGNVYRAEVLFRARLSPFVPGREVPTEVVRGLWDDLSRLLRDGVRRGQIVTVDAARRGSAVPAEEAFYVYRRAGLPCRRCGTAVLTRPMAARNLFWCPACQVSQPHAR